MNNTIEFSQVLVFLVSISRLILIVLSLTFAHQSQLKSRGCPKENGRDWLVLVSNIGTVTISYDCACFNLNVII